MPSSSIQQNLIVASLPEEERVRLVRRMAPVDISIRTELIGGGSAGDDVYFPTSGMISIVCGMADGSAVEGTAVGAEGWVGIDAFGGSMTAGMVAIQQVAGSTLRMPRDAFHAALRESPAFASSVERFKGVMLSHAMQTAACNRLHDAVSRCARWLLFTYDRVGRDDLALTHEFLAQMLGASRSAVTVTIAKLESHRLIESSRAHIFIRDAAGLARVACECQQVLRDVYARYMDALSGVKISA